MFFHSLSEKTFTKGLKIVLSESTLNPLGVTFQQQLYDAWQRAAEEDNITLGDYNVEELFGCWEHQEGYPLVFVERSYNDHRVRFTQVNYFSLPLFLSLSFSLSLTHSLSFSYLYNENKIYKAPYYSTTFSM